MNPDLKAETYVQIIRMLRDIVYAWELCLQHKNDGIVATLARDRSRLVLIEEDLSVLGVAEVIPSDFSLPTFNNEAQILGAMYVVEGSRLGGQLIAKHVESALGLEHGRGTRYFRGFEDLTSANWKDFLAVLRAEVSDESTDEVIIGAKKMFGAFRQQMGKLA